jgi:hypothetical protein
VASRTRGRYRPAGVLNLADDLDGSFASDDREMALIESEHESSSTLSAGDNSGISETEWKIAVTGN